MPASNSSSSSDDNSVTTLDLTIKVAGDQQKIKADEIFDFIVEADLDHPDMASVVLTNSEPQWSSEAHLGDDLELIAGPHRQELGHHLQGRGDRDRAELCRQRAAAGDPARAQSAAPAQPRQEVEDVQKRQRRGRGQARWPRPTRSPPSSAWPPSSPVFEHIYQHNQTDLKFVRLRAARLGYDVWVEDKKLHFEARKADESAVELSFGTTLEKFTPRLSTANQVSKVSVHGWDWNKKEAIVGGHVGRWVGLASKKGADAAKSAFGEAPFLDVDLPVFTQDEATKIAKSIMRDRMMSYITGDGVEGRPADQGRDGDQGRSRRHPVQRQVLHHCGPASLRSRGRRERLSARFRFASDGAGS